MKELQYCLVDVFTNRAFSGNPLAVFMHADGLSPDVMQALAKELNLSETTFVLPAQNPAHDYHVRIFTPAVELPMAGHPTVGTAFVLAHEHMVRLSEPQTPLFRVYPISFIRTTMAVILSGPPFSFARSTSK
jgi:trans-2,3-dihydro-3-hydroxyanthranilate isomerase